MVALDGDLGSSFVEYISPDLDTSVLVQENDSDRLEDGIKGFQKAIHSLQTPRQRAQKNAQKADRAALEVALQRKAPYPALVIAEGPSRENYRKTDQLTTSSPPETAQEAEEDSLGAHTPRDAHEMQVAASAYRTEQPTTFIRDTDLRNSQ